MLISLKVIVYDSGINSQRFEPRDASEMDTIQELNHRSLFKPKCMKLTMASAFLAFCK